MKKEQTILAEIIAALPEGTPQKVCIGLHWTAVVMDVGGSLRCGLASTQDNGHHQGIPDVPQAGELQKFSSKALANLVHAERLTLVSVGMAAINALLPQQPLTWAELNAEDVIASVGADQSVALVGHFPFVDRLRPRVGKLTVLEQNPKPGDLPSSAAEDVIPNAQVVAITGMSFLNHTFDKLLSLCNPKARIILLGPSVPLSPVLFEQGVEILCGSIVTAVDDVVDVVVQGGNFRQVHRAGVHLVTIRKPRE